MKIKRSLSENVFDIFNVILLILIAIVMLYPMWYVLCASFSDSNKLVAHEGIMITPLDLNISAYEKVFANPMIIKGYINTILYVVIGTVINMVLTIIGGYCTSLKNVYWSGAMMKFMTFTMFFSGGLIPMYLLVVRTLDLGDTIWALLLPGAISTYNLIIIRTGFASIPDTLIEAAKLDGATHLQIIVKIVVPLSKATIAVIALYYIVGHWNSWFPAAIYLDTRTKFPLQLVLREILLQNSTDSMAGNVSAADQYSVGESIKYGVIVVATVPILIVYPYLQKYFTKGVMIGAVKG